MGVPPSAVSLAQRSSISAWVSQATEREMASVKGWPGPPFMAMNGWPSRVKATVRAVPGTMCMFSL